MLMNARLYRPRLLLTAAATLAVSGGLAAAAAAPAAASTTQISIFEPGAPALSDPTGTMQTLRLLGVQMIRLPMGWYRIAPDPFSRKAPHFQASNPAAYPAANWAIWDTLIRIANSDGIAIDLDLLGRAPYWGMSSQYKTSYQGSLYPSPSAYKAFYEAVAKRYSGTYTPKGQSTPLPRVSFWTVWNEPDYISSLRPQGTGRHYGIWASPVIYRNLVGAAWGALHATGHSHDTFVFGELTPRSEPTEPQNAMYPVTFLQRMYCVGNNYRPLRGTAASQESCPTSAARFKSQNPALFGATGVSVHPYSRWNPPTEEGWHYCNIRPYIGLCTDMGQIPNLTTALDRLQRVYGSSRKFPIYSTEYGYQTSPPKLKYDPKAKGYNVSQATAAEYINEAEYISYKNPRIMSYDQYLLEDPVKPSPSNDYGSYASGLETWQGDLKPAYYAYRLPLWLPKTTASSGQSLEVWGGARPAPFASLDTGGAPQTVEIQFEPSGSSTFTTLTSVTISNKSGYFDTHVTFPSSGTVQLAYTYPPTDMLLAPGYTVFSRAVTVTVQ
jgi:hypothetical protein